MAVTWDLWQVREFPPMLPLLPLPQVGFALLMIVTALWVLAQPRWGMVAHLATIVLAIVCDQTREQPEIISMALVMLGTLEAPSARFVGRAHLMTMWLWAGGHKLLSAGFYDNVVPYLMDPWLGEVSDDQTRPLGIAMALPELLFGVLLWWPRLRRPVVVAATLFHLGIFLTLSPVGLYWNESVWAWNLVLAVAGWGLFWPWHEPVMVDWRHVARWAQVAAVLLLVSPIGYYFGVVDAYLSHCLYSGNTLHAETVGAEPGFVLPGATWEKLAVPVSPSYRNFRTYFQRAGKPGQTLRITDPRYFADWWGGRVQEVPLDAPSENKDAIK
ncbi:MAG: hypothetical protein JSS27_06930 [Planctomycetes bacterium]|nr:hypothetical protein [Planctomycetota bacterium]